MMKKEGIESSLSFKGDQIVFLGRPFSHFTTVSRHLISESLCVEGTTVFPDFIPNIWGAPGKIGNILHALSVLLNGTFSLVHKGSDFVLYGPDMCASLFSVPALPTAVPPSTPIKERTKYDIKDKSTSKVLWENLSMRDAVLFIIKDYCSKDPTINYFDLQKLFGGISTHLPQTLNNIEIEGNAKAYYDGVNADDSGNRRYFYNEPITLSSGEVILITTQWSSKDNFNEFRKVADDLGYIIIEAMV